MVLTKGLALIVLSGEILLKAANFGRVIGTKSGAFYLYGKQHLYTFWYLGHHFWVSIDSTTTYINFKFKT